MIYQKISYVCYMPYYDNYEVTNHIKLTFCIDRYQVRVIIGIAMYVHSVTGWLPIATVILAKC